LVFSLLNFNGDVYVRRTTRDYPIPPFAGMKPIEIHQQLSETCNDGVMDVKNVSSWVRQFKEGRTSCENKPKEPRPCNSQWSQQTPKEAFAAAMQSWR